MSGNQCFVCLSVCLNWVRSSWTKKCPTWFRVIRGAGGGVNIGDENGGFDDSEEL